MTADARSGVMVSESVTVPSKSRMKSGDCRGGGGWVCDM